MNPSIFKHHRLHSLFRLVHNPPNATNLSGCFLKNTAIRRGSLCKIVRCHNKINIGSLVNLTRHFASKIRILQISGASLKAVTMLSCKAWRDFIFHLLEKPYRSYVILLVNTFAW